MPRLYVNLMKTTLTSHQQPLPLPLHIRGPIPEVQLQTLTWPTPHDRRLSHPERFEAARYSDGSPLWNRYCRGRSLSRSMLFAVGHDNQHLLRDSSGRPHLMTTAPSTSQLHISLSHCGDTTLAALSSTNAFHAIGVDLERNDQPHDGLLEGGFTSDEQERIFTNDFLQNLQQRTLRIWCAKEALVKALGTGFKGRPDWVQWIGAEPGGHVLHFRVAPELSGMPERTNCLWKVHSWQEKEWTYALCCLSRRPGS